MEPLEHRVIERINRRRERIGEPQVRWKPRRAASALKRTTIGLPEHTSESYGLFIPVAEPDGAPRYHNVLGLYGSVFDLGEATAQFMVGEGQGIVITLTETVDGVAAEEVLANGTLVRYAGFSSDEQRRFIRARNEAYQNLIGPSYGDRIVEYLRDEGTPAEAHDVKNTGMSLLRKLYR